MPSNQPPEQCQDDLQFQIDKYQIKFNQKIAFIIMLFLFLLSVFGFGNICLTCYLNNQEAKANRIESEK